MFLLQRTLARSLPDTVQVRLPQRALAARIAGGTRVGVNEVPQMQAWSIGRRDSGLSAAKGSTCAAAAVRRVRVRGLHPVWRTTHKNAARLPAALLNDECIVVQVVTGPTFLQQQHPFTTP